MRALIRCMAVVVAVAATAVSAFADGTVPRYEPNAHTVGGVLEAGEEQYVPMDLPQGTLLTLILKADKKLKSTLRPTLILVGPDGQDVDIANPKVHPKKGYSAKKIPLSLTGRYVVVVRGLEGTFGGYQFKAKAKLPKVFKGEQDFGTGPFEIPFPATLDAKVSFVVAGKKGQTLPANARIARPDGNAFGPPGLKETKTGVSAKNFVQGGALGTYTLQFQLRPGTEAGTRTFKYKIIVKFPKAAKAKYTYDDLIVAPLVTGFTPDELSGDNEVVTVVATGRFFQPGTALELQSGGSIVQVDSEQPVAEGLQGIVNPFGMSPGSWDVVARSPSGGEFRLPGVVDVLPAQPRVASVAPATVRDDVISRTLTLTGTNLGASSVVLFRRALPGGGEELIQPTLTQPFGAAQLNVTVNLFHRPLGLYDVEVFNKGPSSAFDSDTATTQDVLEIINAPPTITSFGPVCIETTDPLKATLDGVEMEAGASLFLQHDTEGDGIVDIEVAATNVQIDASGTLCTADFDMTGQPATTWSVVFRNPDQLEDSLDDVLVTVDGLPMLLSDDSFGEPDLSLGSEHDLALLTWLQTDEAANGSGNAWTIMGRLLDTDTDTFAGAAFAISDTSKDAKPKRWTSASYNPESDEWLVVWTEETFASFINGIGTSGNVQQVYGRRVDTNGQLSGAEIDFINHDTSLSGQFYDEFPYENPQVVYAPWDRNWYLTMTQEWDATTGGREDYDVYLWRVSRTNPGFDSTFAHALHTTQNHEGDCLTTVNPDRNELFVVGACDSRQSSSQGPREIQGKIVTSTGSIQPGTGGSNVGQVFEITTRQPNEAEDIDFPRTAYDGGVRQRYLVVYERTDESGSGKKEIRGQLTNSTSIANVGSEFVIAADADHDLIRPHVVYNSVVDEYLVTWTVDDVDGDESFAMARRVPAGTPSSNASPAVPLGCSGSGFPVAQVDPVTGEYIVMLFTGYDGLGTTPGRIASRILVRRIP